MGKMTWLLQSYPHPQEQFMILTPVLRRMLNPASFVPSALNSQDMTRLCVMFKLGLNIYVNQKDSAKISCFHKIFAHESQDEIFSTLEISFDNEGFSPVRKNELDSFKETAIQLGSKQHAFMQSANPDKGLRGRLRALQENLRKTYQTGVLHTESQANDLLQIEAAEKMQGGRYHYHYIAGQPHRLISVQTLSEDNDPEKLVEFIEQHQVNVKLPASIGTYNLHNPM